MSQIHVLNSCLEKRTSYAATTLCASVTLRCCKGAALEQGGPFASASAAEAVASRSSTASFVMV